MIFKFIKTTFILFKIFFHILTGIFLATIFARDSVKPKSTSAHLLCWWHRRLCFIFNVKQSTYGEINTRPTLFIANHISWFDIPAIGSQVPLHFLSKDEVRHWPLIGWLAKKVGTLFIQRGTRGAAEQSINDLCQALLNGDNVLIFPEGTTTDGKDIKKFHSRLFEAAIKANADVQAIAIIYPSDNGIHPQAAFIDDMLMMDSVNNFIHAKNIQTEIHFLDIFKATDFSRDELTTICAKKISSVIQEHHTS